MLSSSVVSRTCGKEVCKCELSSSNLSPLVLWFNLCLKYSPMFVLKGEDEKGEEWRMSFPGCGCLY